MHHMRNIYKQYLLINTFSLHLNYRAETKMASNINLVSGLGLGVLLTAMMMSIVSLVTDHWTEITKPQSGMNPCFKGKDYLLGVCGKGGSGGGNGGSQNL